MMEKEIRNMHSETDVSCETCIRRKGCERYAEGTFCGKWASREAEPRGKDPNQEWLRGNEVEF